MNEQSAGPTIKPTVGRVVWFYWTGVNDGHEFGPRAAIVTHVWSDHMVNLVVFKADGTSIGCTSVNLGTEWEAKQAGWADYYATWMPYQVGQARAQAAQAAEVPAR